MLLAALVLAASSRRANAATDTVVRLEYQADEQAGCVGEDELRRMVTDQLGHDPFRPDADRRVAITIARTEAGFPGADRLDGGGRAAPRRAPALVAQPRVPARSPRTWRSPSLFSCSSSNVARRMTRATAARTPSGRRRRPATKPSALRPRRNARVCRRNPRPARPRPRRARLRLAVGAGPAVGMGMTPDATALGRLFVTARFAGFSAEIAADAALPATQREPDGTGVVVEALGASAAGCAHVSVASACLLGRIGWIRARRGRASPRRARHGGGSARLGCASPAAEELGRFIVSVHADGLVMLSRWNVVLNDAVVWSVPRVGAVVGLDVALRFF